jgi:succinate dehydrogenase / fumarate reductase cytochrome b subunit
VALASGPEAFATAQAVLDSWFGGLVLFLWTLVLFYHLGNGVRHLAWDAGYGYDLATAYTSGYAVLAFAGAATMLVWLVVLIA